MPRKDDRTPREGEVQGDDVAARRFQEAERGFARKGPVARKAREAAEALGGPQGPELEAARRRSAMGEPRHFARPDKADQAPARSDAEIDRDLEATFPASDPTPANPGAD